MNTDDLKKRTKRFALDIIFLSEKIPYSQASKVILNQLLRSGTSVGANYRSACKARSHADFIAKIGIVEEEADESVYWLELLDEAKLAENENFKSLIKEAEELTAIFTASGKTAKSNKRN